MRKKWEDRGAIRKKKELDGKEEDKRNVKGINISRKLHEVEGPIVWTNEHECAVQAIKEAIATNAMAPPDLDQQYHLAVDASKRGVGGVLLNAKAYTEATNSESGREGERLITFLSFRLEEVKTHYSNSEREALAVVRFLAEVKWMILASIYPTLVYTNHEALKVLLIGPGNNPQGRIAK